MDIRADQFPDCLASKKELQSAMRPDGSTEWDAQINGNLGRIVSLIRELDSFCSRISSISQKTDAKEYYANRLKYKVFAIAIKGYMPTSELNNFFLKEGLTITRGKEIEIWRANDKWEMELWQAFRTPASTGRKLIKTFSSS